MKITYELINSLPRGYKPEDIGITSCYVASVPEFILEYRDKVHAKDDIIWWLCRNEFMTNKELHSFAIWCLRQYVTNEHSINELFVAERYVDGLATVGELSDFWRQDSQDIAYNAAWCASYDSWNKSWGSDTNAAWIARNAATDKQIDKLLAFFNAKNNNQDFSWK